jgi:hypothetical protein
MFWNKNKKGVEELGNMAAMIDYQSRDIKKIKEQVNQLFLDLMN